MTTRAIPGRLPAAIPVEKLFEVGGYHYYLSSCCIPPEHWGVSITLTEIDPSKLGCQNNDTTNPPQGPSFPSFASTEWPVDFMHRSGLESISGIGNIGNRGTNGSQITILDKQIVTIEEQQLGVQFKSNLTPLDTYLSKRQFRLTKFHVTYKSTNSTTACSGLPATGHTTAPHNSGNSDEHASSLPERHAQQALAEFHFWLADCTQRQAESDPEKTCVLVDGYFSAGWTSNPDPSKTEVNAGRLLRLTALEGDLEGQVIFVFNDVS